MTWLKNNWDKVLGIFLSVVVAGLVGFFTAIRATDSEITNLKEKIVALETDANNLFKPKIVYIEENKLEIERIIDRQSQLEKENDIHKATYNLLSLSREEERRKTVNALREILKEK